MNRVVRAIPAWFWQTLVGLTLGLLVVGLQLRSGWSKESSLHKMRATEWIFIRMACCLEQHRLLAGDYPSSLSEIRACASSHRDGMLRDSWGEPISYDRSSPGTYRLSGCEFQSRCQEQIQAVIGHEIHGDGFVWEAGREISPYVAGLPNHSLSLDNEAANGLGQLEMSVTSRIDSRYAENGWGFVVKVSAVGRGKWKVNHQVLAHDLRHIEIWEEDSATGWDGKLAQKAFAVECSNPESKLMIEVHHRGGPERDLSDNFALLSCSSLAAQDD